MNYGGYGSKELIEYSSWQEKFCWFPTNIQLMNDEKSQIKISKWVWLRKIYIRKKRYVGLDINAVEYEYSLDLFDLIKNNSK